MGAIIAAAIGLVVGGLSYAASWGANAENAKDEMERVKAQRDRNVELMDLDFAVAQKKAKKEADQADEQTTLAEAIMGENANAALEQLGLGQEAQAEQYNLESMNIGASKGGAYNTIGGSGTRGSSALQTVEMQASVQNKQLQTQENMDRANAELNLASAMNVMQQGTLELQQNRTNADELRKSYSEGGEQYNIFQKERANYIANVGDSLSKLEEETKWGWDDTIGVLTGGVTGATQGYKIGSQMDDYTAKWGKDDTSKKLKLDKSKNVAYTPTFNNVGSNQAYWGLS